MIDGKQNCVPDDRTSILYNGRESSCFQFVSFPNVFKACASGIYIADILYYLSESVVIFYKFYVMKT